MTAENTKLFDWKLKNPIIVASGPFSNNTKSIEKAFSYGAGAVVTKTIARDSGKSYGVTKYKNQVFNRDGYSLNTLEQWEEYLEELRGKKVIANIFSNTPEGLRDLANFSVSHGIEVLELGLSCPTFGNDPICFQKEQLKAFCNTVRKSINVPIIVKLLISTSREQNRRMIKDVKECGIDAVSLSDSLPALVFSECGKTLKLGGAGGISGPILKPLVMKTLCDIQDIGIKTIGVGGVETAQDVIDYLSMGVEAVQVCSLMVKNKMESIRDLNEELKTYLHNCNLTIEELKKSRNLFRRSK